MAGRSKRRGEQRLRLLDERRTLPAPAAAAPAVADLVAEATATTATAAVDLVAEATAAVAPAPETEAAAAVPDGRSSTMIRVALAAPEEFWLMNLLTTGERRTALLEAAARKIAEGAAALERAKTRP